MSEFKKQHERLADLFLMTDKNEIAKEIDILLQDHVSDIATRLESEFHYHDTEGSFLASTCYIMPPRTGEFIELKQNIYEIIKVIHTFNCMREAGKIIVKKVKEV
ncbi:hypothetical protein [Chryseobacterium scophthalmum]|uniref:hypothetical protein n=1 Tax=Chryseobacterium scophthalmum TaxID=59733 RepID=UPI000C9E3025|nr:hypothetical protein [Chryseobacterium scophthalmum]